VAEEVSVVVRSDGVVDECAFHRAAQRRLAFGSTGSAYQTVCGGGTVLSVSTTRVTITLDDGVYQDALAAAAEHQMSVSAWIARCTRLETMRDALTRHQQWCAAEGLAGPAGEEGRARVVAEAAAELDRLAQARGRNASDAA
jgi:hypothetical protein